MYRECYIRIGISDIVVVQKEVYTSIYVLYIENYIARMLYLVLIFPLLPSLLECPRCMDEPLVSAMPEHSLCDEIGLSMSPRR